MEQTKTNGQLYRVIQEAEEGRASDRASAQAESELERRARAGSVDAASILLTLAEWRQS